MSILLSLLVLSLLIFFHELGHFLAARYFGVFVEKFSIGFGNKLYAKTINGTEYRISAIPLGGYVQMKGQNDTDPLQRSSDPDSYNALHPWQRILILFAGPFANFLIAFCLYIAVGFLGVNELTTHIGAVQPNSPAAKAGLMQNDRVVAINGERITLWKELSRKIRNSEGALAFTVLREGKERRLRITPQLLQAQNIFKETIKKRMVGIRPSGDFTKVHLGFAEVLPYAFEKTKESATLIVKSVQKLIEGIVPAKDIGGVVSIMQITAKASEAGIVALFMFTALISVNLGVLNLLPIPALDGGHIMFNLYELITRKAPSERVLYTLTISGWVLLIGLMGLGLYNDINRLTQG